jgi:RNA polymerase sigma-70 factor (ECF subfamily)
MVKVQQGDQAAFTQLVHRHVDALYNYALRLSHSPTSAEDLVQESWLAAWSNATSFDARKAKLTTWLHRILHNKFIDTGRKQREIVDSDSVYGALSNENIDHGVAQDEQLKHLERLINQLPQEQKAALVLRHMQGFGNNDISQIMGISVRAVESLLARARRRLREQTTQDGGALNNTELQRHD